MAPTGRTDLSADEGSQSARDAALVARVLRGDNRAYSDLYETHVRSVHAVVASGISDAATRSDCVQETFVRALERLSSLREHDRFRPWLLSIARNVVTDVHRNRARTPLIDDDSVPEAQSPDPTPAQLTELSELASMVDGCVAGLSDRDATAVALVTYFDFTPAEVADALGVSVGAAKVAVHRARRRLRDALITQVAVKGFASTCPELNELRASADVMGAERHARSCDVCLDAVQRSLAVS